MHVFYQVRIYSDIYLNHISSKLNYDNAENALRAAIELATTLYNVDTDTVIEDYLFTPTSLQWLFAINNNVKMQHVGGTTPDIVVIQRETDSDINLEGVKLMLQKSLERKSHETDTQ